MVMREGACQGRVVNVVDRVRDSSMSVLRYSALFALLASVSACGFLPDSWSDWTDNTPVIDEAKPVDDTAVKAETDKTEAAENATGDAKAEESVAANNADSVAESTSEKSEKVEPVKNASRFTTSSDDGQFT